MMLKIFKQKENKLKKIMGSKNNLLQNKHAMYKDK